MKKKLRKLKPILFAAAAALSSPLLAGAAIVSTASPAPWVGLFVPTTGINDSYGKPVAVDVTTFYNGSPWDGSGVAEFATRDVKLDGLGITDGSAPNEKSWISVNYGDQGNGQANNGYLVFLTELDVKGSAGDFVDYNFGFAGDNRVMSVSVTDGTDTFALYTYDAPKGAPEQGDDFYKGYLKSIFSGPGNFVVGNDFTTLRLQVELFNEQNLDSFGSSSPTGLIFAGSFTNGGPSGQVVPETSYLAPLGMVALVLGRWRRIV